jgi:hypothetical protein
MVMRFQAIVEQSRNLVSDIGPVFGTPHAPDRFSGLVAAHKSGHNDTDGFDKHFGLLRDEGMQAVAWGIMFC